MSSVRFLIVALVAFGSCLVTAGTEFVVWDKRPIVTELHVGEERLVYFGDDVSVGLPSALREHLHVTSAGGVLYLNASSVFPKSRIIVQYIATGEQVFLDVVASKRGDAEKLKSLKVISEMQYAQQTAVEQERFLASADVSVQDLVRYASQDSYAPTRLKVLDPRVSVTDMSGLGELDISLMFMGVSAGMYELTPLKQYRTVNYYLTAIKAKNTTASKQYIRYSDVYPDVVAVSSQHPWVGSRGGLDDTTLIYLVTKEPLHKYEVYTK